MGVIDFIFPKKCLGCGSEGVYICGACIKKVPPGGWVNLGGLKVYSMWRYKGVIKKAILALKYKYATDIADELVGHMKLLPSSANLIPIPSFWYRQNLRGFNQAELLGEKLCRKMRWKLIRNFLVKSVSTSPQVGLKGSVRHRNLKGAFSINGDFTSKIPESGVLFDDVLTTGSTLTEAAKVLKRTGVRRIWCITVAR